MLFEPSYYRNWEQNSSQPCEREADETKQILRSHLMLKLGDSATYCKMCHQNVLSEGAIDIGAYSRKTSHLGIGENNARTADSLEKL